ncbi:hypothetical protein ACH5RR_035314 [Cinchona calisaya]|uniref:DUF241 domain protein n=1 Tax=Cinchona calisaya TaxID=153742 RepID=A0ABD2YIU5_9GENT
MTPKMVANFRRSLSFTNQPSSSSSSTKHKKIYHVRSTSLPCRSHPLISQLKDAINELKCYWAPSSIKPQKNPTTSSWICDGLTQLKIVQESLDDLLHLPQTRESLRGHNDLIDKFLDDFLRFVDVYGIFQTLLLTLKEQHFAAQVAIRRRDDSKMDLYFKNLKKLAKDFGQLASAVQCMGKYPLLQSPPADAGEDGDEIGEVMKDVIQVTASVSLALFNGLSASLVFRKRSCLLRLVSFGNYKEIKKALVVIGEAGIQEFQEIISLDSLRKKGEEELKLTSKRMHELEDCIVGIEIGGERVFRSLINTRVSLLNVLTH